jgi:hypothetical protein
VEKTSRHALWPIVALGVGVVFPLSAVAQSVLEDPAVQEIIALEARWMQAENTHDADGLRSILDEGMLVVSDRGVFLPKE